jgi:tripartite-type tricarboxylate transporter receptor subunit TctC
MMCMAAAAATPALPTGAFAQTTDYPTRPVTLIVPFPPAGGLDMMARHLQPFIEKRLGKPFIVENRPGGGTTIGAAAVARAAPDGYTMLFATSSPLSIAVNINKNVPYDPVKDFIPVSMIGNSVFVFVTTPSLPPNTLADFIKLAKEKPGTISFGSGGPGSIQHLFAEMLQNQAGIKMVHVPYRGDAPVLNDMIAGHIPCAFVEVGVAIPFIQAGKVKALGVSSTTRVPATPDIPTIAEAGVPTFDAVSWQMFAVPAGTPRPIVDKLHTEIGAVIAMPEVYEEFVKAGRLPAKQRSVEEMSEYIRTELVRWTKVVQDAGVAGSQ